MAIALNLFHSYWYCPSVENIRVFLGVMGFEPSHLFRGLAQNWWENLGSPPLEVYSRILRLMYCKYYALYRNWNGCRCVQRSTCQISLLSFKNLSAAMPQSPNSSTHIAPLHISFYPISLPSETPASSLCVFQYLAHSPVTIRELVALHFASWFKREKNENYALLFT